MMESPKNDRYATRIIKIADSYFVDFKYIGSFWKGFFRGHHYWQRWSMVPSRSENNALIMASKALKDHRLNYRDYVIL